MTRTLVVWGSSSGAGKSWLATALCRLARRRGIVVAPFKAQNMSNNARVVQAASGWGEIGTAQYLQALAAGVIPHTDHNPVLLKPETETRSQVVVNGVVQPTLGAMPWRARAPHLAAAARPAFERLARRHELIVVEGAGSPAEINLADVDVVNLHTARWAREAGQVAALLVTDIDRGGAFAHAHGTWALLPQDLRPLLQGFVFNRFRGDASLLVPGPAQLKALTGVPLVGVIPMHRDHGLPEEDGLHDGWAALGPAAPAREVAVIAPPALSNLDEFAPLARVPGLRLRWVRDAGALAGLGPVDLVVLPGSKQTISDLAWLRAQGLTEAVQRHAAQGGAVLGVCGGLQMLGESLHDPEGHDGLRCDRVAGLGLLPLRTHFGEVKRLRAGPVRFGWEADAAPSGPWAALAGLQLPAYEIRCGATAPSSPGSVQAVLRDAEGNAMGWQAGPVLGVATHGLFESAALMRAMFGAGVPTLEEAFDTVADIVEQHLDAAVLDALLGSH